MQKFKLYFSVKRSGLKSSSFPFEVFDLQFQFFYNSNRDKTDRSEIIKTNMAMKKTLFGRKKKRWVLKLQITTPYLQVHICLVINRTFPL